MLIISFLKLLLTLGDLLHDAAVLVVVAELNGEAELLKGLLDTSGVRARALARLEARVEVLVIEDDALAPTTVPHVVAIGVLWRRHLARQLDPRAVCRARNSE